MNKVLITGVTGFLGSHIGRKLIDEGNTLVAIYREGSSKKLCKDYEDKVFWVCQNNSDWIKNVVELCPDTIIHCAWVGVTHYDRLDWESQIKNIDLLNNILRIAKEVKVKKFIALGSQAEYGNFHGNVDEEHSLKPTESYARIKIICSAIVQNFCEHHCIDWYWLRLFSFFGTGESADWLIPTVVRNVSTEKSMNLTLGEQKYTYLHAPDLGIAISNILARVGNSGIYNISGKVVISIRELVEKIARHISPNFKFNFGEVPYRKNQSMHMQGNSSKFIKTFGEFEMSNFDIALCNTINHIRENSVIER